MSWYRTGSISVTAGSAVINGAGTDFVANVAVGEALLGPDLRVYEVGAVVSATVLTLVGNYVGATAAGLPYAILPTQSSIRDLALAAAELLNTFGSVRDGIGQGLIGDGSAATPAIRFAADQDTGLYRASPNAVGISAGGAACLIARPGSVTMAGVMVLENPDLPFITMNRTGIAGWSLGGYQANSSNWGLRFNDGAPALVVDTGGNLLVGATSGVSHRLVKGSGTGDQILDITGATNPCAYFYSGGAGTPSPSAANMKIWGANGNGRSINAAGTVNASGADYAEYMIKAIGCGTIAAGDVCGVDRDGHLTRSWADAASFVVKSTDPAYVGGDSWAAHLPARPESPGAEPPAPLPPGDLPDDGDDAALAVWRAAAAGYPARLVAHTAARATWQAETDAYARDLAAWEAALETERQKVDRIAFCGQVPVNVTGDFAVGDYLIAVAAGAGIKAIAVPEADITFDQYRRRLGKVWAVREGRAWVDVQHG